MATFYLTFGQQYRREPHPTLGARPELPDGWLTVEAETYSAAWDIVIGRIGWKWSELYDEETFGPQWWPAGDLGSLDQALAHHRG